MSEHKIEQQVEAFRKDLDRLRQEIGRVIVGQREIVDGVITCLLASGHALLEGVPGLGKTMLVRTLAEALALEFRRIQFTPDLMPSDVIGTNLISKDAAGGTNFVFHKGPIFANIVLADEINRATPKTQSALLEAMQEQSVTVAKITHQLERPFVVLATQNPLEMEGTYPLPEAQLDRFLLKLEVKYPKADELNEILDRTTSSTRVKVEPVLEGRRIVEMGALVREVPVAPKVRELAVRLLQATHPDEPTVPRATKQYVRYGSSPRGAQAMLLAAKVRALLGGRFSVSGDDLRQSAKAALRHRIILNFEGEAEGISADWILDEILKSVVEG